MNRWVIPFALLPAFAVAQTVSTIPTSGLTAQGAPGATLSDLAGVFGTKQDYPPIGFQIGPVDSSHPSATGGVSANNLATVAPAIDCPTSTQNSTSVICIRASSGSTSRQPYAVNVTLDGYAGATGDNVALFGGFRGHAGARQGWALNTVTHLEPSNTGGGIGYELDLNNWSCDGGANGLTAASGCSMSPPVGLLITGASPYPSSSAIEISGVSTANAQWHDGIEMLGGSIIDRYSLYTNNASQIDYEMGGNHLIGLDLSLGSFSQAAIRMGLSQGLVWAPAGGNLHYLRTSNTQLQFGNIVGNTFTVDDTSGGSFTGGLTVGGNISTGGTVAAGALTVALSTPTSSTQACTVGQEAHDATYIYWCNAANHWLRVAGSSF